ncbi:basal body-orientation factor 1 [Spea bombifrons]|uniref:basal body-orientation factor 1 n=1 Tax=Spea bombifrons TaxID=233779 RepID=UPI0023496FE9|nr:basal body-orientation factor 1 [Spea bombifrons]
MPRIRGKAGRPRKGKRKKTVGKASLRADRESEVERARASAALWEARLRVTEFSRVEYREAARSLAQNNEELARTRYRLEKDIVDVVGFLKEKDVEKDEQIEKLQQELKTQKKSSAEENHGLVQMYSQKVADLQEKCSQKENEICAIKAEFKKMKGFPKQKAELEKELEEIKETLQRSSRDHEAALRSLERRFLEEKQHLEREAENKIMQLAQQAHEEAVRQLDEAGRSVFKENVRLKESLSYHMAEIKALKKAQEKLQSENTQMQLEKETTDLLVKEKVLQAAQTKAKMQELQQNVNRLEGSLERKALEVQDTAQSKEHESEEQAWRTELQKLLEMKDRELNRVKKLARNIVEERTEVERFFLEALEQVKQEIASSRSYYRKVAKAAFHGKMMQAVSGSLQYPKIRTFHNKERSTNDVAGDLQEAEKWSQLGSQKVDFGDLTWEQKEHVLRLLFAKMNGFQERKKNPDLGTSAGNLPKVKSEEDPRKSEKTEASFAIFITQQDTEQPSPRLVLPSINIGRCSLMG